MNRLRSRALSRRTEEAPVDPMSSIGNLADAMLVLAVGIMLALILNWNVDISTPQVQKPVDPIPFEEDDLTPAPDDSQVLDGGDLQEMGTVYYDAATGTYYIVQNGGK